MSREALRLAVVKVDASACRWCLCLPTPKLGIFCREVSLCKGSSRGCHFSCVYLAPGSGLPPRREQGIQRRRQLGSQPSGPSPLALVSLPEASTFSGCGHEYRQKQQCGCFMGTLRATLQAAPHGCREVGGPIEPPNPGQARGRETAAALKLLERLVPFLLTHS